jgi:hypothetical protein
VSKARLLWLTLVQIEGLFGIIVGVLFTALFPKSPANPVNLLRFRYFTERESAILVRRVLLDDHTKDHTSKNVTREELKRAVRRDYLECRENS